MFSKESSGRKRTRAELRVVLVMKLAEEEVSVSGYDTMDRESGGTAEAPAAPCRAFSAWISRRSTSPSKRSRSCGVTSPRTSDSRENCHRGEGQNKASVASQRARH